MHYFRKLSLRYNKDFYNFSMDDQQDLEITTLSLKHGNSVVDFDFSEESDGTRRLFDLMDMLLKTDDDETVYVIDELERSLHPKLTYHFIELFKKLHEKKNVQLIFTTHEPTIMDQELFRRDEIWRNSRIQVFFVCKGGRIMAPVRSYGNWHIRKSDQEPAVDPYCKYYFIAEGANTEKFYFEKLIDERKSLGFKDTIDIRFLENSKASRAGQRSG